MRMYICLCLFLCGVLFPCSEGFSEVGDQGPVNIGALMPLTGEFAMQGAAFREGIELAVDEINSAGGVNGRLLKIIIEDTQSSPKLINNAAQKLTSVDKVVAAITITYPETEIGGSRFQQARIPSLALWDSSPQIDAMGEYIFSIGPWVPSGAEVAATFGYNQLNARNAIVVNTVEPWSELIADLFVENFKKLGGKIQGHFRVNPGDGDFRTIVARIKSSQPDMIYAPLTNEIVPFHQQISTGGVTLPRISSDIISDEHISNNPAVFEGIYQSATKDPNNAMMRALESRYENTFKKKITMGWFVATGHDAVKLFAHAIQNAGADSEKIKDFLYTVQDFPGAAQNISISSGGSSPYYSSMFQIRGGTFVAVE